MVMFGLDEGGAILFVRLARSSGRPAFDRACLASVRAAGPLPTPPVGTPREELVFTAPIQAAALDERDHPIVGSRAGSPRAST